MAERRVSVTSEVGLHARPAATFVQTAAKASFDVTIAKAGGAPVSAKSILSVLALDVRQGESIVISAEGEGADALLDELAQIAAAP
ncbi:MULTISPECIES: HPr family phosphocarrier protein [Microbispora]|uniref:Phosphocarrier protein HPr n=3 Tax=Microbispora TaxID=2005 RepID=A0ABY3LUH2_9ACTN|nr:MULTISPECIES: HPr family phosphocarrier protein [Microbispora]RGA00453.1 HPr family phosphocarrier protein [Microbispora triticiradicis]TLP62061.1 HPr family phosphocarrier protein [Microbispora fusca]TYB55172.1 HPr family phosphocarrier protein [Microbispora tritici]GLW21799.1 phosphocarrier protein [Microbispora amethystogenes]